MIRTAVGTGTLSSIDPKTGFTGQTVAIEVTNSNPSLNGAPLFLGIGTGPFGVQPTPTFPGLAFDAALPFVALPVGVVASSRPARSSFSLPAGDYVLSVLLQGIAPSPRATNRIFAATAAHRIDVDGRRDLLETLRLGVRVTESHATMHTPFRPRTRSKASTNR